MANIISPNCRIRVPEYFRVGEESIIDDYSYFSTRVEVGRMCHIGPNCSIAGGREMLFRMGDYSSLSSGVRVYCRSSDYVNSLAALKSAIELMGDITIGSMCGVGANSVIMPDNTIPDGTVVGALSFVPTNFKFREWSVYAGNPLRLLCPRNKGKVLEEVAQIEKGASER